jgi:hypothetical protein
MLTNINNYVKMSIVGLFVANTSFILHLNQIIHIFITSYMITVK